jgi:hypothetical protein
MAPLNEWIYNTDQDIMPDWFDAVEDEKRARAQFENVWAKERLVRNGDKRDVNDGDHVMVLGGTISEVRGGTILAVLGGTISEVRGGTILAVRGGTISAVLGGTISAVLGGTISEVWGGTISAVLGGTISFRAAAKIKLTGLLSVIIDRTSMEAKCHVGASKARTISIGSKRK